MKISEAFQDVSASAPVWSVLILPGPVLRALGVEDVSTFSHHGKGAAARTPLSRADPRCH